jgi:hypothetical protein
MSWFIKTLTNDGIKNIPKIFVETGCYRGEGIQDYLSTNYFNEIHSLELSEEWYNFCKDKFKHEHKVKLHLGDSATLLETLDLPNEPILFYLDAHFSGGTTAGENIDGGCPLLRELDIICKRRKVKGDIVVVDDMRLMGTATWSGFEEGNPNFHIYPKTYFDFTHITLDKIKDVFEKYKLENVRARMADDIDRLIFLF